MKKILFFILFSSAFAEDLDQRIQQLAAINPEEYPSKITEYTSFLEKEIETINYFCEGEVSRNEKVQCREKIKVKRINYLNSIFFARKNYLNYLHEKRLEELEQEKQKTLGLLN